MHYSDFLCFIFMYTIHCHLVCLKNLMCLFQCLMKPIVLIAEPRNSGLPAASETVWIFIFLYGDSELVFWWITFWGVYTDELMSTLFILFQSLSFLSGKESACGLMNWIHWSLSFPPQTTLKSSSGFRGISAISMSLLISSQGLGN